MPRYVGEGALSGTCEIIGGGTLTGSDGGTIRLVAGNESGIVVVIGCGITKSSGNGIGVGGDTDFIGVADIEG